MLSERGVRGSAARLVALFREGRSAGEFIVIYKDLGAKMEIPGDGEIRIEDMHEGHLPDIAELNRRRGEHGADQYFRDSLRNGVQGIVAYEEEHLVGYIQWVDHHAHHPDFWSMGPFFKLLPGDAYMGGLYLLPRRRGRGAGSDFLLKIEQAMREKGFRRVCGFVESTNEIGRRIWGKHGWYPTWTVHYVRVVIFRRRRVDEPTPL